MARQGKVIWISDVFAVGCGFARQSTVARSLYSLWGSTPARGTGTWRTSAEPSRGTGAGGYTTGNLAWSHAATVRNRNLEPTLYPWTPCVVFFLSRFIGRTLVSCLCGNLCSFDCRLAKAQLFTKNRRNQTNLGGRRFAVLAFFSNI